jgi:hypothetical protein
MSGYLMFKNQPQENEEDLRIMFGPIVYTNETTLILGGQPRDATSSSDEFEEDVLELVAENPTPGPTTRGKQRDKYSMIPLSQIKKDMKDEYMKRIVQAIESRSFSTHKTINSVEDNPIHKEVDAQLEQVIEDGATEGSDLHFFVMQLLIHKHHRDVFVTLKTKDGRATWPRRAFEIAHSPKYM